MTEFQLPQRRSFRGRQIMMAVVLVVAGLFALFGGLIGCAGAFSGVDVFGKGGRLRAEELTMETRCDSCHRQTKPGLRSVPDLLSHRLLVYNHDAEPVLAAHLGKEVVKWLDVTMKTPSHAAVVVPEPERTALFSYLACQQFYRSPVHCGR